MDKFENLLERENTAVERFVKFKINNEHDADDVLQEVYLTAYQKFSQLKNETSFKPWIISIARNKCNDYFREKVKHTEVPIDDVSEHLLSKGRLGRTEIDFVNETVDLRNNNEKQVLYLYFWKDMPQSEIAKLLNIPLGTVKSRLYTAKRNFKNKYPCHLIMKGDRKMKMPVFLSEYLIEKSNDTPFSVKCEELMGWFIIPKLDEKLTWASYDMPSRALTEYDEMQVVGKAKVHGISGVEISVKQHRKQKEEYMSPCSFVAQLTDTHCRYLAATWNTKEGKEYSTFLDGDTFMDNWGFGEDNCGNETYLLPKENIERDENIITTKQKNYLFDIVGRYNVTINGKTYDTVCVMEIYNNGIVSEQYLDKNGRTILWRRFNKDDWAICRYKSKWSEMLPDNEQLIINGEVYVHWYDCITDYIL